jgi:hypothetical protein
LYNKVSKLLLKGIRGAESAEIVDNTLCVRGCGILSQTLAMLPTELASLVSCNHIRDVEHCLGIDAAYYCLVYELGLVFGDTVSMSHITLLASFLTYTGSVSSANYQGVKHNAASVTQLIAFERPLRTILDAALTCTKSPASSVMDAIMLNKQMQGGPGNVDIRTTL